MCPARNERSTILDALGTHAADFPDKDAFRHASDDPNESSSLTFSELDRRARAVGNTLRARGASGTPILLLYPPSLEFLVAFWGCIYGGAIAVPAFPPAPSQMAFALPRIRAILDDARPFLVLTSKAVLPLVSALVNAGSDEYTVLATDDVSDDAADAWRAPDMPTDAVAMIQFTSGSTSLPRGVVLTFDNLATNLRLIAQAFGTRSGSVGVSWLPLYHDMGLIGMGLSTVMCGGTMNFLSPLTFLRHPSRWLEAISRTRATISGAPNFGYELCVARMNAETLSKLDLSSWEIAFTGAEPVRASTLERFSQTFSVAGFNPRAFYPCYGLAEATLMVTGGAKGELPKILDLDAAQLERGIAVPTAAGSRRRSIVSCGRAFAEHRVIIVEPDTLTRCPPMTVGEIWTAGPSVAAGYLHHAEASRAVFGGCPRGDESTGGQYLRTGDLGFLSSEGDLFVTGRLKDLIIVRGLKHHPHDIELTVEGSSPAFRAGACAAFSVERSGEEELVVVAEVKSAYRLVPRIEGDQGEGRSQEVLDPKQLLETVRQLVAERHQLRVQALLLVKSGTVPKTSSGKIQRFLCRQAFIEGTLEAVPVSES